MSKMKNYMMDIEDFCNVFANEDGSNIDEVIEDVRLEFSSDAAEYARQYLTELMGEDYG